MKPLTYILTCIVAGFAAISCTETPDYREFQVPEIVSMTSLPEIYTARLESELNAVPLGRLEVGFYIGTDKTDLRQMKSDLDGKSFSLVINELNAGTEYWFKAYVTNGKNEVTSQFESFMTDEEPVIPDDPVIPDEPVVPDETTINNTFIRIITCIISYLSFSS
mgnify:CR=1 FL=1